MRTETLITFVPLVTTTGPGSSYLLNEYKEKSNRREGGIFC